MEAIDIRDNFPVINGGDGVILSKRGDICVGWEVQLPPAFRCNESGYDSLVGTLAGAIALLPDYTIVHKQDIFMRKRYHAEKSFDFLEKAYEEHFDGREYLDHRCLLWLSFSSKKNVRSGSSGLLGLAGAGLPSAAAIGRCLTAAEQFGAMLGGNSLLSMRRLTEEDIFGADKPGLLQDNLNFADGGADVLSDIQVAPGELRIGDKSIVCHLFADLDQLPGEVASCKRNRDLSTENSAVMLSFLNDIGQALDCEHVVNWFCVKEPLKDIHGSLDSKRRQMQSMSARNAENRKYAEEINEYLETAAVQQMSTVRCHLNVFSVDENATTTAISKLGITPVRDTANAPAQFWTSIPGNESGLAFSEYMTMELQSGLCLNLYDGFATGIADGVLKMSDRIRLVPQRFDIQEKALDAGLIENYNVFLLGPSGSGKSFFMNKYLRSCYVAGQHCFLIDVGDSYRALCHIIKEESGGKDGTYYTFEKGKPISFNPFRNVKRFSQADSEAMNFLFTLMVTLWKNGKVEILSSAEKYVRESISAFLRQWDQVFDPVFNDYFEFVRDVFGDLLKAEDAGKEYFDLKDYLISLEQFYNGGPYDYLLNSSESVNILEDRFVVFEIDHIKGDPVIYPITTLVIMDAFMEKMTSNSDFKVMCIEEAWKAIMGTQMATYMLELWKTARKHRTAAMVVTQELKDITSSPIIKDSIVENSGVKILLDQTKYLNRFEVLASELSLSEDDKSMVLSLNRLKIPGASGREVFFNLGNKKSFVMRLEVSPEERIAFSSAKKDKERLAKAVEKSGGSYIK
ncbi:MAG: TraG family conjugative transposon ATPase, partial [Bacteroidales bacterium]|nr:TraG family conjugative transposon ATPase [Bacteroidales bacterium]